MRNENRTLLSCTLVFCLILAIPLTGCGKEELAGAWKTSPITIDGDRRDWQDGITWIDDQRLGVGIMNDAEDLYLCLITDDRSIMGPVAMAGLVVWFDNKGGDKETFGIAYPLGMGGTVPKGAPAEMPEQQSYPDDLFNESASGSELEIHFGKDVKQRFSLDEVRGIEVAMSDNNGTLVYELKVPLAESADGPWAIGAGPGGEIGVGLQTGEFERPERGKSGGRGGGPPGGGGGPGGAPPGGGGPGGGMGRGGPPGGGGPGGGGGAPEQLDMWAKVTLAQSPDGPELAEQMGPQLPE